MAKRRGKPTKALESYLQSTTAHKTSLSSYLTCPASTFLTYVCDANDAFVQCRNKFTKKGDGKYNTDSEDSLRHISCSILATTMGHFETYERTLFAGLFERTRYFPKFNAEELIGAVEKAGNASVEISAVRLAAYRGIPAQVGLVVADALKSWHSPSRVNGYLRALGLKQQPFSAKDMEDLQTLWQLRHSIVHTGAWITLPDSQKVPTLLKFAEKPIVFQHTFVNAVARRLHKIVKEATTRIRTDFLGLLGPGATPEAQDDVTAFLAVASPTPTWLK